MEFEEGNFCPGHVLWAWRCCLLGGLGGVFVNHVRSVRSLRYGTRRGGRGADSLT